MPIPLERQRAWYGNDSQNPLPPDGGGRMGCGEWTSSSVPEDEVGLRRNELLHETLNMSGEREGELTAYPAVQLPVLVCRFVGMTRVRSCFVFDSIVPSIVRASRKHQDVAGTVTGSNAQDPPPLSYHSPVATKARRFPSNTPTCSTPGLRQGMSRSVDRR